MCTIPRHWPDVNTFIKWSIYLIPREKVSIGDILSSKYWMIPKEKYAVGVLWDMFFFSSPPISEHDFKGCIRVWGPFQHSGRKPLNHTFIFEQSLYQEWAILASSWLLNWKIFTSHVKDIGYSLSEFHNGWKFVKNGWTSANQEKRPLRQNLKSLFSKLQ